MNEYSVIRTAAAGNICSTKLWIGALVVLGKANEKVAIRGLSFGLRQVERLGRLRQSNSLN